MEQIIALVALTAMEIVLGIDNIVFITIITARLPLEQQPKARRIGLMLAMGMRILLLFSLAWILGLNEPFMEFTDIGVPESWFEMPDHIENIEKLTDHERELIWQIAVNEISIRDLILLGGGLFLIWHAVREIHHKMAGEHEDKQDEKPISYASVLVQIALLDIVFSLDSVITAVGMVHVEVVSDGSFLWNLWHMFTGGLWVMVTAVVAAVLVMLVSTEWVSKFVHKNPTVKMLALSFLILIGVMLVAEGIGTPINKKFIYFAMVFALSVEMLNLRIRKK